MKRSFGSTPSIRHASALRGVSARRSGAACAAPAPARAGVAPLDEAEEEEEEDDEPPPPPRASAATPVAAKTSSTVAPSGFTTIRRAGGAAGGGIFFSGPHSSGRDLEE